MNPFELGSEIAHPVHGEGVVTFVGDDYVGLRWKNGQEALLRKECFFEEAPAGEAESADPRESLEWPQSTFIQEEAGTEHFLGSHWAPFFEDSSEVFNGLEGMISRSQPKVSQALGKASPRTVPEDWPKGTHLVWPGQHHGIGLTLSLDPGQGAMNLMAMYPFFSDGIQQGLVLDRVEVWEGGAEAQITAEWGPATLTFFDTDFLHNRPWYESGTRCEFILTGIAYQARLADAQPVRVPQHPEVLAWMRRKAEQAGEEPFEEERLLNFKGAAILLPIPQWDQDDYQFRGPIKAVKEVHDVLGQDGWVLRATVLRGDEDFDLDILVTLRAWEGAEAPRVGEDVEGQLWLQGRLWRVPG